MRTKIVLLMAMILAMMGFSFVLANPASANVVVYSSEINCEKADQMWVGDIIFTNPEPKVEHWTATATNGTIVKDSGTIENQTEGAQVVVNIPAVKGETSVTTDVTIHANWEGGGSTTKTITLSKEGICFDDTQPSPSPSVTPTPSDSPSPSVSPTPSPTPSTSKTSKPPVSPSPTPSTSKTSPSPLPSPTDSCSTLPPEQQNVEHGCLPHTGADYSNAGGLTPDQKVAIGLLLLGAGGLLISLTSWIRRRN